MTFQITGSNKAPSEIPSAQGWADEFPWELEDQEIVDKRYGWVGRQ